MLNAFTAQRMADSSNNRIMNISFFSRFELMRERLIRLCEAYIKNAAKNGAFSCSFTYYFSANDEIAKCEDYLWHADVQDALRDAGYSIEIRDHREGNYVAINISWQLTSADAREEIEELKDMIINGLKNSRRGKKSRCEFTFSNDDECVMGKRAIELAEAQLEPDIAKCFDEAIWGGHYEPCIKYMISAEWK